MFSAAEILASLVFASKNFFLGVGEVSSNKRIKNINIKCLKMFFFFNYLSLFLQYLNKKSQIYSNHTEFTENLNVYNC